MVRQPVSVGGSGSTYIYGFMDSNYKPGLSKDQCLELTAAGTRCCCKACWDLWSTAGSDSRLFRLHKLFLLHLSHSESVFLPVCLSPVCLICLSPPCLSHLSACLSPVSLSQLCLWRWRETAPAAVWSDWRASQKREWRDGSYWGTSCQSSPHTEHTLNTHSHTHTLTVVCSRVPLVLLIKVSVCLCRPVLLQTDRFCTSRISLA